MYLSRYSRPPPYLKAHYVVEALQRGSHHGPELGNDEGGGMKVGPLVPCQPALAHCLEATRFNSFYYEGTSVLLVWAILRP